ncbi:hypothetical protein EDD34_2387 [Myceligenerans xiligouense]|uniref:Uncharacterized protein n=1 Tax=Myceligenerans xiligouense TaxID=253184 RepID=A0A3N4Z8Q8_9MICO|nr:hypothetical protein EDD34_2387 [Myceligenerans xiligouense]
MSPGHDSIHVHGTWNTVPIDTRTERRYSGSAHRGVTSTASTPSAAALRKAALSLVHNSVDNLPVSRQTPAVSWLLCGGPPVA